MPTPGISLKRIFARKDSQDQADAILSANGRLEQSSAPDALARRRAQAIEGILGTESLTRDLDDEAAAELVRWGVSCAEQIVASTAGLDDAAAEVAMSPRLQAAQRVMMRASRWLSGLPDGRSAEVEVALQGILQQASIACGEGLVLPGDTTIQAFVLEQAEATPQQAARNLRALLEESNAEPTTRQGERFEPSNDTTY